MKQNKLSRQSTPTKKYPFAIPVLLGFIFRVLQYVPKQKKPSFEKELSKMADVYFSNVDLSE